MNTNRKDEAISKALNDTSIALNGVQQILQEHVDLDGDFGDALQLLANTIEQQASIVSAAAQELARRAREGQPA